MGNSCGYSAAIGDIDGDGDLDIYVANGFFNKVEVDVIWLNQGGMQSGTPGTFVESEVKFPATRSWEVRFGDLDNDQKLDIIVTNGWGRGEDNQVYLNITGKEFPVLNGDYLGQAPPGNTPVVFAPGIISVDGIIEHSAPTFSPDGNEVFWQANKLDNQQNWLISCMTMRRVGNTWTTPEVTPYDFGPTFSPDGKRLYFDSKKDGKDPRFIEKHDGVWSEPKDVGIISRFPEIKFAYNLSIASNGTIYFLGYAAGLWNNLGIYRTELFNGEYIKPALLPPEIMLPGGIRNWTPYIAPDESYFIFSSSRGTSLYDQGDLFVCFNLHDGKWTNPVSLGKPINSNKNERFPAVSPDGKYLFFTRSDDDYDEGVLWVSAEIIDSIGAALTDVKKDGFGKTKNFKLNQNYPNPFNPSTVIKYQISENNNVKLKIYDSLGQEIKTLVDSFQNIGEYSVVWNATDYNNNPVCSGVYFYSLISDASTVQKKMMLVK